MKHILLDMGQLKCGSACRRAAVVFFLIASFITSTQSQTKSPASKILVEGEDLIYNVRYGFVDLGQVKIKTLKRSATNGATTFKTIAYIDSYKKIPFVNLHAVFESLIDSVVFSHFFVGKSKDGDYWNFGRYIFDYPKKKAYLEFGGRDTIIESRDTLTLSGRTQDGLSLFFYARDQLFSGRTQNVPAIVKEKNVNTVINFAGKQESVELDFVDYPVDAISFDGTMEFTGIFGLTGDFEGWFSNDEARVPILAKMKVILGSVTIELMEWKRAGWTPPRAQD
ncbi:MAG: DUF3108 domain-containing protein [Ignavibacteriae bacterium]|nr:DUF3108 domain-containing protein [Ignavibacteriota bacterium]